MKIILQKDEKNTAVGEKFAAFADENEVFLFGLNIFIKF